MFKVCGEHGIDTDAAMKDVGYPSEHLPQRSYDTKKTLKIWWCVVSVELLRKNLCRKRAARSLVHVVFITARRFEFDVIESLSWRAQYMHRG